MGFTKEVITEGKGPTPSKACCRFCVIDIVQGPNDISSLHRIRRDAWSGIFVPICEVAKHDLENSL